MKPEAVSLLQLLVWTRDTSQDHQGWIHLMLEETWRHHTFTAQRYSVRTMETHKKFMNIKYKYIIIINLNLCCLNSLMFYLLVMKLFWARSLYLTRHMKYSVHVYTTNNCMFTVLVQMNTSCRCVRVCLQVCSVPVAAGPRLTHTHTLPWSFRSVIFSEFNTKQ